MSILKLLDQKMDQRMGHWQDGTINGDAPWRKGKIMTGVYREDEEDVLYNHSGANTTITHFWNADYGDESTISPPPYTYSFPNSYQKIMNYWNGNWDGNGWLALGPYFYRTIAFFIKVKYNNLPDAFNDHSNFLVTAWKPLVGSWDPEVPPIPLVPYLMKNIEGYSQAEGEALAKRICWEIVGRICHLIEDSGVPAHAHNDIHPSTEYYEDYFIPTYYANYNWVQAWNQGGLIDINNKAYPLRFALYTTNQIADRFKSDGLYTVCGDSLIEYPSQYAGENYEAIIRPIYESIRLLNVNLCDNAEVTGHIVATKSFLYSMRSVAGYLWYVYNQFDIQKVIPPTIYSINYHSNQDHKLFKTETATFSCDASGTDLTYNWFIKTCYDETYFCSDSIPGLTIIKNGSILKIRNDNFKLMYTCQYYHNNFCVTNSSQGHGQGKGNTSTDPPLTFSVGVTVTNSVGTTTQEYKISNIPRHISPYPVTRPADPPPNGGCPFLFVYNGDSGKNIIDNNILHRSENPEFAGQNIDDKYVLSISPGLIDNKFSLGILEPENDFSYFDQIKLYAIDHSISERVVITENNEIAIYDLETVISSEEAYNNSNEVTQYIQFDTAHPLFRVLVTGVINDSVKAEYNAERILSINKELRKRISGRAGAENIIDSLAIIAEIGQNLDIYNNHIAIKDYAGAMTIDANTGSYEKFFSRRENNSPIVIPFSTGLDAASNVEIKWFRDYQLIYLSIVDIFYTGFTQTEIPLVTAFNSTDGDMLQKLQSIDLEYAELDSSSYLSFEFSNISPPAPGKVRDYVFVVNGHYTFGGEGNDNKQTNTSPVINRLKNIDQNKLIGNYPNPFNPSTTINYQISKAGIVKLKIYDVLGREIVTLVNEFKNEGNYQVMFDGINLSSGIFYYKLETDDYTAIKKMLLIK